MTEAKVNTPLPRKRLTNNARSQGWRFVDGHLRFSIEENPKTSSSDPPPNPHK